MALLQQTKRFAEAEPLARRSLNIAEKNLGPDHPDVGVRLNNLAKLLEATERLEEAEPLLRKQATIFIQFTRRNGHRHPHLDAAIDNYLSLLKALGRDGTQIESDIAELMRPN